MAAAPVKKTSFFGLPIFSSGQMLYLIGLGLGDEKDITVKGLEAVKSCSKIFLEAYTSILGVSKEKLVCIFQFFNLILVA